MRWWGWGQDGHQVSLPEPALALLRDELGADLSVRHPPVALEEVRLPEPRLARTARARLEAAVGAEHVMEDRAARVRHAAGRSYADLVRLRSGDASRAPDAVVAPGSADQVRAVLEACSEARVAVVPFGGGTSVVGGVEPVSDGFDGAVALDLRRLDRVVDVDRASLTATLEAGLLGPEAERRLGEQGVTLGHFPQSFEYSTVGGWVATRSAGQASSGYGRIDELVEGLRLVAPAGEMRRRAVPASAAGPDLSELVVGSEGVLGVICETTLRVRPVPELRRYEGWSFRSFAEGREAFRVMEQADAAPDVARLSDEEETRVAFALASAAGGAAQRAGRAYLRVRGHEGGCLAIAGFEGEEEDVERRRLRSGALLRAGGGVRLGRRPGEAWLRGRYAGPYLRDELLDRGLLAETLETAVSWSGLEALYEAVGGALRRSLAEAGTPAVVMCHVSHLYRSGASLYFTFLARQSDAPLEQWRAAKSAASEAIMAAGGTITHHHAVGRDHAAWMPAEVGEVGLDLIRAAKQRLDPAGIMNPGKLLPD
ncbi:MAG TPA: FAD-binding oxidoreductase [Thermoleophilaceae bacterium]|nr:FAD-binding oxidoreductase [Thermoleophilaceae bacterium]